MFTALLILQVVMGLTIIGLVLLQQGKGADMGAAFGAGASGSVFGSRGGSSFFTRATAVLAALFFANSIVLSSPLVRDVVDPGASVTSIVPAAEESDIPAVEDVVPAESASDLPPVELPQADLPAGEAAGDLPDVSDAPAAAETPTGDTPE